MAYDRRQEEYDTVASARVRIDYESEVGRTYVPVGVERGFVVLDPDRAAALRAWTRALIPRQGDRPAADEIGAAEYIDATAFASPRIRPYLLAAIDEVDRLALARQGKRLRECDSDAQLPVLRDFAASDTLGVFNMVRDFTYEAYYGNPRVLAALRSATGWDYESSVGGSEMEDFDEALLERMKGGRPHYREV